MELGTAFWIILILSVIALLMNFTKVFKNLDKKKRKWITVISIVVIAIVGLSAGFGNVFKEGQSKISALTAGVTVEQATQAAQKVTSTPSGVKTLPIDTLVILAQEVGSNAWDAVGNATVGYLKFYPEDVDPVSASAKHIEIVNISAGKGTLSAGKLVTDTKYRVIFDGENAPGRAQGSGDWYSKDYGVIALPSSNFNPNTGSLTWNIDGIYKIGTLVDPLNETAINGDINGATDSGADNEIGSGTASGTDELHYNETTGDGTYYIKPELSLSGANVYLKNLGLCFEFDTANPPEGNEVTAITYQLESGTDFGLPSDWLNYWKDQQCLLVASEIKGGISSKFKLTFTVDETNLDANDDFALGFDDLVLDTDTGLRALDIGKERGLPVEYINFDASA